MGGRPHIWLRRVHQIRVSVPTIQRICRRLGYGPVRRTPPRRRERQLKLLERERPGESLPMEVKAVKVAGLRTRSITPRRPEQHGKVERRHRIDDEACWTRHTFTSFDAAARALEAWQHHDNHDRFSMALQGQTPAEKLARFSPSVSCGSAVSC